MMNDFKIRGGVYLNNCYLYPYSSFAYNKYVHKYKWLKPKTLLEKSYFYVYSEEGNPLMVLPLTLSHGNLSFYGDNVSGSGHLDLIYNANITDRQIFQALYEIRQKHKGYILDLHKLNERSRLYSFLSRNRESLLKSYQMQLAEERICYKICFGEDYDTYFQGLTKNSKSNLKKCYNRIKKQEISMKLVVTQGPFSDKTLLSKLMHLYTIREGQRIHRKISFGKYLKNRYFSALTWAMENMQSHHTFTLMLNGNPAAFMSGFLTNYNEIVFPIVSMNIDYQQFFPGKLMISESVKYLQQETTIRGIDLSRGDERYKREMGGKPHYNYACILHL